MSFDPLWSAPASVADRPNSPPKTSCCLPCSTRGSTPHPGGRPHLLSHRSKLGSTRIDRLSYRPQSRATAGAIRTLSAAFASKRSNERTTGSGRCRCDRSANRTAQKKQRHYYSGKQKCHTLKAQLVVEPKSRRILSTVCSRGRLHDLRVFKNSRTRFAPWVKCLADKGYQGLRKVHANSQTPSKKPLRGQLSVEQKRGNRAVARQRIVVEHVNRRLKVFRILAGPYRNRRRRFGLRLSLLAGIYNYELSLSALA
ncbi:transposase [Gloeobacter kilaueensis JS1]|uniref:Transposase n=1 Tax=Gloeobacter kilaueensis (strain ATCC BAA-2537 / CCAP 1431/1 / ULC 316 / JS1) TaxID=1183438 RepID=U5QLZ4_GLOK1|nr:transposase [Gloeobacter kilaueensis JS1]